jgi:hypothetical protein
MMRRRLLLFALTMVLTLIGTGWTMRSRPGITEENAAKIQEGMTLLEVEAILGGPGQAERRSDWPTILSWQTDDLVVYVCFRCDNVGRELVETSIALPIPLEGRRRGLGNIERAGPWDLIRRWLKL